MTPCIRTLQNLVTRLALTMSVLGLTAALAVAQGPVAPAQPAPAAQPAPMAITPPAARPAPRPLPSRGVKLEVTLIPVAGTVAGAPRVLTLMMADGRFAKFRRQGQAAIDHFSLDATSTIVSDRQVLVEFNLSANASDRSEARETPAVSHPSAGIAQEGSVLLAPGVKQRVAQLEDSGSRPGLHVEMLVEIVK